MSGQLGPSSVSLLGIDPSTYERHPLHATGRAYPETNCYADILIELLHARGAEPLAILGPTVGTDFEGDQFTFFKPRLEELETMFGVDVHEMQPYRPIPQQAAEQLASGRTMIVELDSYYLPDTGTTTYRKEHVKSSVIFESVSVADQRLRYFHNAGLYDLNGDDFLGVFHVGSDIAPDLLPPYTELVRFDAGPCLAGRRLRAVARERLSRHLDRRPTTNPFARFGVQLAEQMPDLARGTDPMYHAYAFATVRMAGSAFELAASYVSWLLPDLGAPAADAFGRVVDGCKTLSFKLARRRPFDPDPALAVLASAWSEAQERLDAAVR